MRGFVHCAVATASLLLSPALAAPASRPRAPVARDSASSEIKSYAVAGGTIHLTPGNTLTGSGGSGGGSGGGGGGLSADTALTSFAKSDGGGSDASNPNTSGEDGLSTDSALTSFGQADTKSNAATGAAPAALDASPASSAAPAASSSAGGGYASSGSGSVGGDLPLKLVFTNNFGGTNLNVWVTGTDSSGSVVMLKPDGSWDKPDAGGSKEPIKVGQADKIKIKGKGQKTEITIPTEIESGRIWVADGELSFFAVAGGDGKSTIVQPSAANTDDPSHGVNWGFVELTNSKAGGIYANISFVDFVGMILGMKLTLQGGEKQQVVGLASNAVNDICQGLKQQAGKDGQPWDKMCVNGPNGKPLRVNSPNLYVASAAGSMDEYYTKYVDQVWQKYASEDLNIDTQSPAGTVKCRTSGKKMTCGDDPNGFPKPSTLDIWGCNSGPFAITEGNTDAHKAIVPRLCAAFTRSTLLMDGGDSQPGPNPETYYTINPTNHYARLVHAHEVDGKGYAFSYDDVNPSGKNAAGVVSGANAQTLEVVIGGPGGNEGTDPDANSPVTGGSGYGTASSSALPSASSGASSSPGGYPSPPSGGSSSGGSSGGYPSGSTGGSSSGDSSSGGSSTGDSSSGGYPSGGDASGDSSSGSSDSGSSGGDSSGGYPSGGSSDSGSSSSAPAPSSPPSSGDSSGGYPSSGGDSGDSSSAAGGYPAASPSSSAAPAPAPTPSSAPASGGSYPTPSSAPAAGGSYPTPTPSSSSYPASSAAASSSAVASSSVPASSSSGYPTATAGASSGGYPSTGGSSGGYPSAGDSGGGYPSSGGSSGGYPSSGESGSGPVIPYVGANGVVQERRRNIRFWGV